MKSLKEITLCLLLIIIGGWGYSQKIQPLHFQKLVPPEIIIPPDAKTMAFVYRNIRFESDTIKEYYQYMDKILVDTTNYEDTLSLTAYKSFVNSLSELYNFDSIAFVQLPAENLRKNLSDSVYGYPPFSWEKIDSISEATLSDIIVSLEKIAVFTTYQITRNPYYYHYYGDIEIVILANWKIYDPFLRRVLNDEFITDTLYFEEFGETVNDVKSKFLSRIEIMKEAADYMGNLYAEKLSPQWETAKRFYYKTRKDKRMKTAAKFLQLDRYESAIAMWKDIYATSKDYHIKGQAAFNIAVISEVTNDILAGEEWIDHSLQNFRQANSAKDIHFAKRYKSQLVKRKEEIRQIKELLFQQDN